MQHRSSAKFILIFITVCILLSLSTAALEDILSQISIKAQETLGKLNIKNIFDLFTSNFFEYSKQLFSNFGICIAIILISSVCNGFYFGQNPGLTNRLIPTSLIALIVYVPLVSCFIKVQEHTEAICGFLISLIPTCTALHMASGNTFSASLMSSATVMGISLLQTVTVTLIIPLAKASLALTAANSICKMPSLSHASSTIKSIALWITGLSFTLFTGILSLQSLLQSGADSLTMKGLKYSAAKLIPIAGGMVSESMKTVISGVSYIKNVTGISGIVFIVYTLVPPLCFILTTKLFLSFLSMFSTLTDMKDTAEFLNTTSSVLNIILALLIGCSASLIIVLAIFAKCTVSL